MVRSHSSAPPKDGITMKFSRVDNIIIPKKNQKEWLKMLDEISDNGHEGWGNYKVERYWWDGVKNKNEKVRMLQMLLGIKDEEIKDWHRIHIRVRNFTIDKDLEVSYHVWRW